MDTTTATAARSTHPAVVTQTRKGGTADRPAYVVNMTKTPAGYNEEHPFAAAWPVHAVVDAYTVRVGEKVIGHGTRVEALHTLERVADMLIAKGVAAPTV